MSGISDYITALETAEAELIKAGVLETEARDTAPNTLALAGIKRS